FDSYLLFRHGDFERLTACFAANDFARQVVSQPIQRITSGAAYANRHWNAPQGQNSGIASGRRAVGKYPAFAGKASTIVSSAIHHHDIHAVDTSQNSIQHRAPEPAAI